jgi:hypothetical protein
MGLNQHRGDYFQNPAVRDAVMKAGIRPVLAP